MNFAGKTAVVTGGSRGIGRAICEELARGGANVVLCYAGRAEAAQETVTACEDLGAKAHQSVEIARANAPTAQRDRFLDREHFCITVVHASQRGHRLQTVPFEQNLLFEQVRNDPDPFHAGQRQTVDFRRCEGLPFTGGNGQIGIEGRRHGLGEISETVQHGQQHDHRRNGHGERKNAHTRNNVDHRTGFR